MRAPESPCYSAGSQNYTDVAFPDGRAPVSFFLWNGGSGGGGGCVLLSAQREAESQQ